MGDKKGSGHTHARLWLWKPVCGSRVYNQSFRCIVFYPCYFIWSRVFHLELENNCSILVFQETLHPFSFETDSICYARSALIVMKMERVLKLGFECVMWWSNFMPDLVRILPYKYAPNQNSCYVSVLFPQKNIQPKSMEYSTASNFSFR